MNCVVYAIIRDGRQIYLDWINQGFTNDCNIFPTSSLTIPLNSTINTLDYFEGNINFFSVTIIKLDVSYCIYSNNLLFDYFFKYNSVFEKNKHKFSIYKILNNDLKANLGFSINNNFNKI